MKSSINIYLHLAISLALIPVILYAPPVVKLLVMLYAVWLIFTKDAGALPAIAIISSYLSNSYVIFFAFILISIINYNTLKKYGVHIIFIVLMLFLPFVAFQSGVKIFTFNMKSGLVLNQFQLYFSMFAFFYGILIKETFSKKVMMAYFITLILLYLLNFANLISPDFFMVRLTFYIIPFFGAFLSYYFFGRGKKVHVVYLLIGILIILTSLILTDSTFTIYLTTFFAFVISTMYYNKKFKILYRSLGLPAFLVVFLLISYAITEFEVNDYSSYKDLEMSDINSFESLSNRMKMKFFDDRAPIWVGVWEDIIYDMNWLPPTVVSEIKVATRIDKEIDFDFHAHNVYLELLRTNGIIMGIVLSIIFVIFVLLARKIYLLPGVNSLFIVFISAALSSMIIGAITGIYVLLATFAPFVITIIGLAYAMSQNNLKEKLIVLQSINKKVKSNLQRTK